jgi:effector-binding domain-containing protein
MIGLGMDAFVGPMYEKGLFNLSNIVAESKKEMDAGQAASSNSAIKVSEVQNESHTFVVKRAEVKMENIAGFYAEHLPAIMMAVGAAGHEPAGMPCGLYYFWDEANGKTDMCAAIPVSDPKIQIEGYETVTLPAGKSVHVAHYGDYDKTAPVHMAIDNYMKANGLEQVGPVMEEYANDPTTVKPEEVLTNVYYPVK